MDNSTPILLGNLSGRSAGAANSQPSRCPDTDPLRFFFDFRAGKTLANNFSGLLRSLLVQLMEMISVVAPKFRFFGGNRSAMNEILGNQLQLQFMVTDLLKLNDFNFCIFIDGLDEYEGDMLELLTLFKRLHLECNNVSHLLKICLASRPDPLITTILAGSAGFRMQDHNFKGMDRYVSLTLKRTLSNPEENHHL